MITPDPSKATQLLKSAVRGDPSSARELFPLVYDQLRQIAAVALRRERPDHTLQPTALVHEAFLRLIHQNDAEYHDRSHFCAVAAQVVRRVLVDHMRMHHAVKRGGEFLRITLDEASALEGRRDVDLSALDDALTRLALLDERQARVVELRFFGGLSVDDAAKELGVSTRTIEQDWRMARAWLRSRLIGAVPS